MGMLRLAICVSGVYGAFLLWAIAQERLSKPFPALAPPHELSKFPSSLFFNWSQALASATCAAVFLLFNAGSERVRKEGVLEVLGLQRLLDALAGSTKGTSVIGNGHGVAAAKSIESEKASSNGNGELKRAAAAQPARPWHQSLPALLIQVSLFQTIAGPIGFLALKHISYPTMVLGKSCKLIPVLLLNVLLYRRRFGAHKYVVVGLVSAGISMFMLFGKSKGKGGGDSMWGLCMLLFNLMVDGLTNSTQDQIFSLYPGYSGQQMMFIMAFMSLTVLTPAMLLPLPANPMALFTSDPMSHLSHNLQSLSPPILLQSIRFITAHPSALAPLAAYAALGGLGQIFIFETISHFGSLTLVTITVTRKLFTMLLSVFVFGHQLSQGQWAGVAVVFVAIGLEAGFKRKEAMKRVKKD